MYLPNQVPSLVDTWKNVPDQFEALALTVEKKMKQWAAPRTAELQQYFTGAVHEWRNRAGQVVELGISQADGTTIGPFLPTGLARDWSYYSHSVLSKEEALQDIAQSEVQKHVWV